MLKVLDEVCKPTKGSKYSAAIDLYAREDVVIGAGETAKVPLGVCLEYDNFPIYLKNNLDKFYLQLEPRSSLRAKGLISGTGIIDIDYKDEIEIILSNPIQYIDKVIDIDEGADYIEIDYLGSPSSREDEIKVKYSSSFKIKKGDKIAQIMLKEHKGHLLGYETETKRSGGFGSTGN